LILPTISPTPGASPGNTQIAADLPPAGLSFDPPSADLFATDPIQQTQSLDDVATLIAVCRKCKLCERGRTPSQAKVWQPRGSW